MEMPERQTWQIYQQALIPYVPTRLLIISVYFVMYAYIWKEFELKNCFSQDSLDELKLKMWCNLCQEREKNDQD